MKSLMKSVMIAALVLGAAADGAAAKNLWPDARHVMSGADFRIISAAFEGMAANGYGLHAPLEGYALTLVEEADRYAVHFSDPNRPEGIAGSSPNMSEFEVQLRKDDLSFIRWIGVR
jgi:hypothetical protein